MGASEAGGEHEKAAFTRVCGRCGRETIPVPTYPASFEQARREGWRRLALHAGRGSPVIDVCRDCLRSSDRE